MPRERFQHGRVELVGATIKKWKGHYYVYLLEAGTERRAHRSVTLGEKSRMTKAQAEGKLREIIARETGRGDVGAGGVTLRWFWENRFLPLRRAAWKESSRKEIIANALRYVVNPLGDSLLAKLDKFTLQSHINGLAVEYSRSVVEKALVWTRAILAEAVEQDFLAKNPARALIMPVTKAVCKRVLTAEEVAAVAAEMPVRFRLLLAVCTVLGLRPGEALALRWDDLSGGTVRVDEGMVDGRIYAPKTAASVARVAVPEFLADELAALRESAEFKGDHDFVFCDSRGGVMRLDNFRHRVLAPAAERAKVSGVTFQAMRRTCATMLSAHGTVKDVQAHMRHAQASTTFNEYAQPVQASVSAAVERLGDQLRAAVLNTNRTPEKEN